VDWVGVTVDRKKWWTLVNEVMNRQLPQKMVNVLDSRETISFSRALPHVVSSLDATHNPEPISPTWQTSVADGSLAQGYTNFRKSRSYIKLLGTRRVT
jgi:hypothetical protein